MLSPVFLPAASNHYRTTSKRVYIPLLPICLPFLNKNDWLHAFHYIDDAFLFKMFEVAHKAFIIFYDMLDFLRYLVERYCWVYCFVRETAYKRSQNSDISLLASPQANLFLRVDAQLPRDARHHSLFRITMAMQRMPRVFTVASFRNTLGLDVRRRGLIKRKIKRAVYFVHQNISFSWALHLMAFRLRWRQHFSWPSRMSPNGDGDIPHHVIMAPRLWSSTYISLPYFSGRFSDDKIGYYFLSYHAPAGCLFGTLPHAMRRYACSGRFSLALENAQQHVPCFVKCWSPRRRH